MEILVLIVSCPMMDSGVTNLLGGFTGTSGEMRRPYPCSHTEFDRNNQMDSENGLTKSLPENLLPSPGLREEGLGCGVSAEEQNPVRQGVAPPSRG